MEQWLSTCMTLLLFNQSGTFVWGTGQAGKQLWWFGVTFTLEKEPLVDRAHRVPLPKPKPGDRPPHAIVAALDCADVLRKTRELQRIKLRIMTISIFTDNTAKTALARADLKMSVGNYAISVFFIQPGCASPTEVCNGISHRQRRLGLSSER